MEGSGFYKGLVSADWNQHGKNRLEPGPAQNKQIFAGTSTEGAIKYCTQGMSYQNQEPVVLGPQGMHIWNQLLVD